MATGRQRDAFAAERFGERGEIPTPERFGAERSLQGQEEERKLKVNPAEPRTGLAQKERLKMFLCSFHADEEAAWLKCLLLGSAPGRLSRKLGARQAQQVLGCETSWMAAHPWPGIQELN